MQKSNAPVRDATALIRANVIVLRWKPMTCFYLYTKKNNFIIVSVYHLQEWILETISIYNAGVLHTIRENTVSKYRNCTVRFRFSFFASFFNITFFFLYINKTTKTILKTYSVKMIIHNNTRIYYTADGTYDNCVFIYFLTNNLLIYVRNLINTRTTQQYLVYVYIYICLFVCILYL